jgi:hypothetical protein
MRPPSGSVYALAHGNRKIIWTMHKPDMISRWPPYITPPRRISRSPAVVLGQKHEDFQNYDGYGHGENDRISPATSTTR